MAARIGLPYANEMNQKNSPFSNRRRIAFVVLALVLVTAYFWTQSRYPALDQKSAMGARTPTSAISFDVIWAPAAQDSLPARILKSTVNWYYTNWKGMTFGLLFAGLISALLSMVRFRPTRFRTLNAIMGAAIGTPLGVCANCVTPISRSLYVSGLGFEAALGSLFSSPALNIVVLTMAFDMLPLSFALAKLVGVAILILLVTPLLGWWFGIGPSALNAEAKIVSKPIPSEPWLQALPGALRSMTKELATVVAKTVPFMLLAGLLGGALAESLAFVNLEELSVTPIGLVSVALVGTLLPVPMTFDVVTVGALLRGHIPGAYAMVLLSTLGVFSVYPFLILLRMFNTWKVAASVFVSVVAVGMGSGAWAQWFLLSSEQEAHAYFDRETTEFGREAARILSETCGGLEPKERATCIFSISTLYGLKEGCDLLDGDRAECIGRMVAARSTPDPSFCMILEDGKEREACILGAIEAISRGRWAGKTRQAFETFCENNRDRWGRDCKRAKVTGRAISFRNLSRCDVLPRPDAIRCRATATHREARSKHTLLPCGNLIPAAQEKCLRSALLADGPSFDESECRYLAKNLQSQCRTMRRARNAGKSGDPRLCDPFSATERAVCVTQVAFSLLGPLVQNSLDSLRLSDGQVQENLQNPSVLLPTLPFVGKSMGDVVESAQHTIRSMPFGSPTHLAGRPQFLVRELGSEITHPSIRHTDVIFSMIGIGRGVSSGDINGDGQIDVVMGSARGPVVLFNKGQWQFVETQIPHADGAWLVALIDWNNDGQLDLFFADDRGAAHILLQRENRLERSHLLDEFTQPGVLIRSAAFFDINKDGRLDLFLGRIGMSDGWSASNQLILNSGERPREASWFKDQVKGPSLSVLASDLNQDGQVDLFVANDYEAPDEIYWGHKETLKRQSAPLKDGIRVTPQNSMGYDSADINNDLKLDLIGVDVDFSFSQNRRVSYCDSVQNASEKDRCASERALLGKRLAMNPGECEGLRDPELQRECQKVIWFNVTRRLGKDTDCSRLHKLPMLEAYCSQSYRAYHMSWAAPGLEQVRRNVLHVQDALGNFEERGAEFGVDKSYYAWNARFGDFDSDGWQDLYVATGGENFHFRNQPFLFLNQKGNRFQEGTAVAGLNRNFNSSAFTVADFDNDGDLDIISNAVGTAPLAYVNNSKSGNYSVSFELFDDQGNSHAVGAALTIESSSGVKQIREVKASGGYLSFDSSRLHFGLGQDSTVKTVRVRWPDGQKDVIEQSLKAGFNYRIYRRGRERLAATSEK